MYHAKEKRKTTHDGRNRTIKSRKKTERSEKKETYKYLAISEADTIKQAEMKESIKKNASGELENYSKPNYIAEIS